MQDNCIYDYNRQGLKKMNTIDRLWRRIGKTLKKKGTTISDIATIIRNVRQKDTGGNKNNVLNLKDKADGFYGF